jgi:hypothetical protein
MTVEIIVNPVISGMRLSHAVTTAAGLARSIRHSSVISDAYPRPVGAADKVLR